MFFPENLKRRIALDVEIDEETITIDPTRFYQLKELINHLEVPLKT